MFLVDPKKLGAVQCVSRPSCTDSAMLDNTQLLLFCRAAQPWWVIHKGSGLVFTLHFCALSSQLQGPPASWHSQK